MAATGLFNADLDTLSFNADVNMLNVYEEWTKVRL